MTKERKRKALLRPRELQHLAQSVFAAADLLRFIVLIVI